MRQDCIDHLGLALPNHFIRSRLHIGRNCQADLLGSFQINDELEFLWLFDWEIGRFGAFENLVHIRSSAAEQVGPTDAIGHKPASFDKYRNVEHRREPALVYEFYN